MGADWLSVCPSPCLVDELTDVQLNTNSVKTQNNCPCLKPVSVKRRLIVYLFTRCYLKLGDWKTDLEGYSETSIPQIIQYYAAATDNDRNCYKVQTACRNFTCKFASSLDFISLYFGLYVRV